MKGRRGPHDKTKTSSGHRVVSLNDDTMASLKRHYLRQAERRLALGEYWVGTDAIFDGGAGEYSAADTPRKHFKRIVEKYGLPVKSTPHWLRHTCATLLAEAGEPQHAIKE